MAVVVFDSNVLIGFLNSADDHHTDAIALVRDAVVPGTRRMLSAVNYSEIMIGPIKAGKQASDRVDAMFGHFSIEIIVVDKAFANRAAAVRARTSLKLPDAYAAPHRHPRRAQRPQRCTPGELRQSCDARARRTAFRPSTRLSTEPSLRVSLCWKRRETTVLLLIDAFLR